MNGHRWFASYGDGFILRPCSLVSSVSSRRYRDSGKPRETPTVSTAIRGNHRPCTPTRELSLRVKTSSAAAETSTSMPKNPPMRLANSCRKNMGIFRPFANTPGNELPIWQDQAENTQDQINRLQLHSSALHGFHRQKRPPENRARFIMGTLMKTGAGESYFSL